MTSQEPSNEEILKEFKNAAEARGLLLCEAEVDLDGTVVTWSTTEWLSFLDLARSLQAPVLYLEHSTFGTHEDDQWFLSQASSKNWRLHRGEIVNLSCCWFGGGLLHNWQANNPSWFHDYISDKDDAESDRDFEDMKSEREAEEARENAEVEGMVQTLLAHPEFAAMRKQTERKFLAQELFPEYAAKRSSRILDVVRRAEFLSSRSR